MIDSQIQQMANQRREAAARLSLFDANLWLGRPQGFPLGTEFDVAAMKTAMNDHLIAGGLVSHWRGIAISPQEGNAALDTIDLGPLGESVSVIVTALPLFPDEGGPLPGLGQPSSRVRGVRLFPKAHGYPLSDWCVGTLCRWLIDRRMPLFLWHTELDWQDLYRLAQTFPELAVVVESQPRKIIYQARPLLALMRDCPNAFVEISNLTGPCFGLALQSVGPERLIFGSFLPVNDPLVPLGLILDTSMPDRDRELIAGGNLRRLIGEGSS